MPVEGEVGKLEGIEAYESFSRQKQWSGTHFLRAQYRYEIRPAAAREPYHAPAIAFCPKERGSTYSALIPLI